MLFKQGDGMVCISLYLDKLKTLIQKKHFKVCFMGSVDHLKIYPGHVLFWLFFHFVVGVQHLLRKSFA